MMYTKDGKLYISGVSAEKLAKKYGTPLYVYEAEKIRERLSDFTKNIVYKNLKIHYAVKANNNIHILGFLKELGANTETVSIGAIQKCFEAGFKPEQIIHTCNGMTDEELRFLIENRIMTNIDSLGQLETWGRLNPQSNISFRLNLGVGAGRHTYFITGGDESKFGIHISNLEKAAKIAKQYKLKIIGLEHHVGTDAFLGGDDFIKRVVDPLLKLAPDFEELEFLDFGGSIGIPYKPGEKSIDMEKLGKEFTEIIKSFNKNYGKEIAVILEPGRYIVAESGTLLAKVTDIKKNPERTFVSIDSGMNHLIRPALYNAYHEIVNASKTSGTASLVSIVGNICESADFFAKDRKLPEFNKGDVAAILNTGAYGMAMASNYNSRQRPAEVMVEGGKSTLIQKRGE